MRTRSRSKGAKRGRKPPERYGTSSEGERGPSPKESKKSPLRGGKEEESKEAQSYKRLRNRSRKPRTT